LQPKAALGDSRVFWLENSGETGDGCQVGVLGRVVVPELAPPAAAVGGIHRPAVEFGIPINPCKSASYPLLHKFAGGLVGVWYMFCTVSLVMRKLLKKLFVSHAD
jgi:hypothetical protein